MALVTFRHEAARLEVDFTQNKDEVRNAIYHLYFPGFSESNVFDALLDTMDRLKDVKGKKSILLLATGVDTFSKHTLDQTMKALRQTDVTIFVVGLAKYLMLTASISHGRSGSQHGFPAGGKSDEDFCPETGGFAWFPQI